MPFYDYVCKSCGHEEIDVIRNIHEEVSIYECPKCKELMSQKIEGGNFILKGNGWSNDGYSSNKGNKSEKN